jgi:hypothetical protein
MRLDILPDRDQGKILNAIRYLMRSLEFMDESWRDAAVLRLYVWIFHVFGFWRAWIL